MAVYIDDDGNSYNVRVIGIKDNQLIVEWDGDIQYLYLENLIIKGG